MPLGEGPGAEFSSLDAEGVENFAGVGMADLDDRILDAGDLDRGQPGDGFAAVVVGLLDGLGPAVVLNGGLLVRGIAEARPVLHGDGAVTLVELYDAVAGHAVVEGLGFVAHVLAGIGRGMDGDGIATESHIEFARQMGRAVRRIFCVA